MTARSDGICCLTDKERRVRWPGAQGGERGTEHPTPLGQELLGEPTHPFRGADCFVELPQAALGQLHERREMCSAFPGIRQQQRGRMQPDELEVRDDRGQPHLGGRIKPEPQRGRSLPVCWPR